MNILSALDDETVFGRQFRDGKTWEGWRVFLASLFGLPMSAAMLALYLLCTGRQEPPRGPVGEAWIVCGRRGGKSFILAVIAAYLACFRDWRPFLGPGELATVCVIAADRKQARVIMRYLSGLLHGTPMLARTIKNETREAIALANRVVIEVHSASFRTTRGYTIVAALCDEIAFWRDENSANPDSEIIAALRPAMATVPGALLLCASSPYARRGALWEAYRRHHGRDDSDVLVWQAASRTMNPSIPSRIIDDALAEGPSRAKAEWLGEFRSDIESYITREAIEAVVSKGARERAPIEGIRYFGFVDPSGGSADSFTLAISHREDDRAILDCLRETKPPFSPEGICEKYSALLKSYRISQIRGDRYAGEWPREQFKKRGVEYRPAAKSKSELYVDLLPAINSGRVDLIDSERLVAQLVGLERRTSRAGKDTIDHPPSGHDDLANAAAGAIDLALSGSRRAPRVSLFAPEFLRADPPININDEFIDSPATANFRQGGWRR